MRKKSDIGKGTRVFAKVMILFFLAVSLAPDVQAEEEWIWKLANDKTSINPKGAPIEFKGGGITKGWMTDKMHRGLHVKYIVKETSMSYYKKKVERERTYYNITLKADFDKPPDILIPGKTVDLCAEVSGSGTGSDTSNIPKWKSKGGSMLLYFQYGIGKRGHIKGLEDALFISGSADGPEKGDAKSWSFVVPRASEGGEFIINAYLHNCPACEVQWIYRAEKKDGKDKIIPPISRDEAPCPDLQKMVIGQRHITWEKAEIKIVALAVCKELGRYTRGDILFSVRVGNSTRSYYLPDPAVAGEGNVLMLTHIQTISRPGTYPVRVTITDNRSKGATPCQDYLRSEVKVSRPAAAVGAMEGVVLVHRKDPTTSTSGITVPGGEQVIPRRQINIFEEVLSLLPERWLSNPYVARADDSYEVANSPFLYEGDRVVLSGGWRNNSQIRSGIQLEWAGGVCGIALFDGTRRENVNHYGEFTIGATRGQSGSWAQTAQDVLDTSATPLFEAVIDDRANTGVDFLVERVNPQTGITRFVTNHLPRRFRPSLIITESLVGLVGLMELSAGDTVYSDVDFIELNSSVSIRQKAGEYVEIFTLEGNPKLFYNDGKSKIVLKPTLMASVRRGQIPHIEPFRPEEIDRWWEKMRLKPVIVKESQYGDYIPSLNAEVKGLKFYEQGLNKVSKDQRNYKTQFLKSTSRYIWWELNLEYLAPGRRIDFEIEAVYHKPDGSILTRQTKQAYLAETWTSSRHAFGWGWKSPGNWMPGKYRVDLFIKGLKVASDFFEIVSNVDVPSLNATVTGVRFYEGGFDGVSRDKRDYKTQFQKSESHYIFWELNLKFPAPGRRVDFDIVAIWYKPDGSVLTKGKKPSRIESGWTDSFHNTGWGWKIPGNWPLGTYRVELYINGQKVAKGFFKIVQ